MEIRDCNPFLCYPLCIMYLAKTHYTIFALCMYMYDVFMLLYIIQK